VSSILIAPTHGPLVEINYDEGGLGGLDGLERMQPAAPGYDLLDDLFGYAARMRFFKNHCVSLPQAHWALQPSTRGS
jgi:hypothetical protein